MIVKTSVMLWISLALAVSACLGPETLEGVKVAWIVGNVARDGRLQRCSEPRSFLRGITSSLDSGVHGASKLRDYFVSQGVVWSEVCQDDIDFSNLNPQYDVIVLASNNRIFNKQEAEGSMISFLEEEV